MILRLRPPRLLPITIFALSGLLAVKSAELVSAAVTATEAQPKAAATETPAPPPQPTPSGNPAQSDAAKPSDDGTAPIVADGERTVLLELRQRRLELDAREATLAARESLLAAAEQKVATRVTELQVLQKKLEALEATRQQREDVSWLGLVKVYESMKPRDAATIFNDLDMPVLLQVIDRMKEAKAAPVLAAMQPDKARDLTARLAQMRTHRDDPGGGTVGG
jgi:flagellar motility protein MotE (MotC chaperone)